MCGEKGVRSPLFLSNVGSPPRVRGKACHCRYTHISTKDHPRVCGEKVSRHRKLSVSRGSPPRMRGKVVEFYCQYIGLRITPAYAGKRLKRSHKIVLFISTPTHFHSVCNRPDITNNNLTALGASVLW